MDPWTSYDPSEDERNLHHQADAMYRFYEVMEQIDALGLEVSDFHAAFLEHNLEHHRVLSLKQQAIVVDMARIYLGESL